MTFFFQQKQKAFSGNASGMANGVQEQHDDEFNSFSAKYLTNQKLFNLQIADSQFRRYFLTQCLIFGSYLTTPNIKSREYVVLYLFRTLLFQHYSVSDTSPRKDNLWMGRNVLSIAERDLSAWFVFCRLNKGKD